MGGVSQIIVLMMLHAVNVMLTQGNVKLGKWLEAANDGDDKLVCEIVPTKEVQVDSSCQIKGILCEPDHWIIQVCVCVCVCFQLSLCVDDSTAVNVVSSSLLCFSLVIFFFLLVYIYGLQQLVKFVLTCVH
jgi:hypothetical protein